MAIREELIASAVHFLQDPSVSNSSVENRIGFLRSKNLTQEEIDVALARSTGAPAPYPGPPGPSPYYGQYPQHAWQPQQAPPRRDWRDWFIMATVVGGVSAGLYSLGKRYVYPLVAPPTPERLEQDKKSISDQFDKAFALVEQLGKDTVTLKEAEKDRTERLDTALAELDSVMSDLKSANRRREDDAQRIRDEVQALKDAIPKAMTNQKDLTDTRLREINTELSSLKTLVSQRLSNAPAQPAGPSPGYVRPSVESATAGSAISAAGEHKGEAESPADVSHGQGSGSASGLGSRTGGSQTKSSIGARSGLNGGSGKASIPAWQLAMSSGSNGANGEAAGEGDPASS